MSYAKGINSIGFIVLNFNSYNETLNLVNKLLKVLNINQEQIFVVDNLSTNESEEILIKKLPKNVTFIQTGFNGGYAYGNNIGIDKAIECGFEYIMVLNNDVDFDNDFVSPLLTTLNNDLSIAFVGPVFNNTNHYVYGGYNNYFIGRVTVDTSSILKNDNSFIEYDWISGAVQLIRANLIDKIGKLPEEYFLNYEENDWQQRAKEKGFKVGVVTNSFVRHDHGTTIGSISGMQEYFMLRNKIIFERKNANWYHKIVFWLYLIFGTSKTIILNPKKRGRVLAYIDGITLKNKYLEKK